MDVWIFHDFNALLGSQVLIEESNCEEIGPNSTLEGCCYFNHPIDHFGPVLLANLMFGKRGYLDIVSGHQVLMYLREQGEVKVFSLVWGWMLCANEALASLSWVNWASSDFCNLNALPIWCVLSFDSTAIRGVSWDDSICWDVVHLICSTLSTLFCRNVLRALGGKTVFRSVARLWSPLCIRFV